MKNLRPSTNLYLTQNLAVLSLLISLNMLDEIDGHHVFMGEFIGKAIKIVLKGTILPLLLPTLNIFPRGLLTSTIISIRN